MVNVPVWFAAHKTAVLGGSAAAVGALALYKRRHASAAAANGTASDGTTTGTAGGSYDSSDSDIYNSLEDQISTLSEQLSKVTAASTPKPTPKPAPKTPPKTAPAPSTPKKSYVSLDDLAAVTADEKNGITLYQSGAEARAWDLKYGTPKGQTLPDPSQYYALSAAAATALENSGQKVYVQQ